MIRGIPYLIDQIHWILWSESRGQSRRGVKLGIDSKSLGTPTTWNLNKSIDSRCLFLLIKCMTRSWANVQGRDLETGLVPVWSTVSYFWMSILFFGSEGDWVQLCSILPLRQQIWVWRARTIWGRRTGYHPFMFKLNAWHMESSYLKVQQFIATQSLSCFQLLKSVIQLVNKHGKLWTNSLEK